MNPKDIFPFPLDDFQLQAIDSLNQGHSVVVSAPTGSGKTLIGEYAIYRAISHGQKVFYTTPLKALSNQKLRDFRDHFGPENVGLLTGDMSLNREASIVVMTTEIFRNMLYAEADELDDPLAGVEAVVLDECHYMNDVQRGTVWEESIIYCPSSVQFVALSATVANAGQLTDWIENVHGPTDLIFSNFRPVPLRFSFCSAKGLHPLLNDKGNKLHPNNKIWRAPKGQKRKARSSRPLQPVSPSIGFVISQMAERGMLPGIYFIFSRRGCDRAVRDLGHQTLVTKEEKKIIRACLRAYTERNPEGIRDGLHADALLRGIAAHHAGVLPAWKELIEELFQQGLIKVVFATETLAAGVNMPARSTVISALSKRTENGHRQLMGSEFLQMAGRAGRRGLDSEGFVVTVQSRFEGVQEAGELALSSADPLMSQFTPSYGMVLNLLQRYDLERSKQLIERSFGRYLTSLDLVEEEKLIEELKLQLQFLQGSLSDVSWDDFEAYEKGRNRLKEQRRLLRILQKQSADKLANELTSALQFSSIGTLITLKAPQLQGRITPGVIVDKIFSSGQFPLLLCLTDQNLWLLAPSQSVVSLHADLTCLSVDNYETPTLTRSGELRHGDDKSMQLSLLVRDMSKRYDMMTPQYDLAAEVLSQVKLVQTLEAQLEQEPAHRWINLKKLKKHRHRMEELDDEIQNRQKILHHRANHHWDDFLSLMEILQYFGCLQDINPTEIGRTVAGLRGDNELWLGLSLMSGHLDELPPSALAGVIESICTEINRPDLWSGFAPSAIAEEAFQNLSGIRSNLLRTQERYGIKIPVWWNLELIGLVEAWANGALWSDLIANTSLDEGDIVRILRRTIDLLSQVPYCEAVSEQLRVNARRAYKSINRFPVCESDDLEKLVINEKEGSNPATKRSYKD
ncbi:DEAD/DEAH box helicase [Prochlorococcus sp. MIT 1223]|uniref:DEAD/DEAH box helicase n=1 Tax=Prochlorococcus sp. MIT 1223 TaxID=3096217 RepID=UPI002A764EE4|nr:DEAD/DEAH box helicase [Prochlorococcus sp. MIT 1223]